MPATTAPAGPPTRTTLLSTFPAPPRGRLPAMRATLPATGATLPATRVVICIATFLAACTPWRTAPAVLPSAGASLPASDAPRWTSAGQAFCVAVLAATPTSPAPSPSTALRATGWRRSLPIRKSVALAPPYDAAVPTTHPANVAPGVGLTGGCRPDRRPSSVALGAALPRRPVCGVGLTACSADSWISVPLTAVQTASRSGAHLLAV